MKISHINSLNMFINEFTNKFELHTVNGKIQIKLVKSYTLTEEVIRERMPDTVKSNILRKARLRKAQVQEFHANANVYYHGAKDDVSVDIGICEETQRMSVIVRAKGEKKHDMVAYATFERLSVMRNGNIQATTSNVFGSMEAAKSNVQKSVERAVKSFSPKRSQFLELLKDASEYDMKVFVNIMMKDETASKIINAKVKGIKHEPTTVIENTVDAFETMIAESEEVVEVQEGTENTEREFIDTSDCTSVSTRDLFTDKVIETISNHFTISEYTTREALNAIHNKVSIKRNNAPFVYFMKNKINTTRFADHKSIYTYIDLLIREYTDWSLQYRF
ncbi:hypothetical protein V4F87_003279 [Vibrio parahaemolyticus]|nr:hypothetical protein [Vibrio parahaemolyticus]